MRNLLPTCTSVAATFLSRSIRSHSCATDEYGKEKRRHDRLSSFLVPAWLQKTMSPVRPYSSWEPQGNSERLYSPLFELLQSFMLCFLLKTVSGKWVVLFWFPPAVVLKGGGLSSGGCKVWAPKLPLPLMQWKDWEPGNTWNMQNALCEHLMQHLVLILLRTAGLLFKHRLLKYKVYRQCIVTLPVCYLLQNSQLQLVRVLKNSF